MKPPVVKMTLPEKIGSKQMRNARTRTGFAPGVVSSQIGGRQLKKHREFSAGRIIESIHAGFPVEELDALQTSLAIPMETLAPKLGISRATLHRRKRAGRLGPEESDRVFRFARLMGKAVEVLESEESARRWLTSPQVGLSGATPLDYARTEAGAREVEDLLIRIEFGVYS